MITCGECSHYESDITNESGVCRIHTDWKARVLWWVQHDEKSCVYFFFREEDR